MGRNGSRGSGSGSAAASPLLLTATQQHCAFAFDVLISHLTDVQPPEPDFEDAQCPLFVTWNKAPATPGRPLQLRGCIGTLEPRRLHTALRDYALTSALRDSRFAPIALREVASLSVGVSLLSGFERADDWADWTPGTHGLIAEFEDATGSRRSATFLPEVAAEQGWTRRQTLEALMRKAGGTTGGGGRGPADDAALARVRLTRYVSSKAALSFADYAATGAELAAAAGGVVGVGAAAAASAAAAAAAAAAVVAQREGAAAAASAAAAANAPATARAYA